MTATATAQRLTRRNYGRGHGYKLDGEKIPGVTTVLDQTLAKKALQFWYADEAAKRAVDEWDELALLPVSQRLERIRYGARDKKNEAALRGTEIHSLGEKVANGEEVEVPAEHRGPVEAYARFLDKWDITTIATETPLASTQHRYGGTADTWVTIGKRDGMTALLDTKTGKGVYAETGWQLAAYRYADLVQIDGVERATPEVDGVFVAHVLPDDVRMLPVVADQRVWRGFLYILQVFREIQAVEEWPLIGSAIQP